jgi:hypothetical protein
VAQVSNRSRPVQPPGRSSLIKADRQKMCYGVQQFAGRHRSQGKIVLLLLCAETPWALSTYDPVEKARQVAEVVCKDGKRKDHRFRPPPFYGFIATADCVGCCLGCAFCWSWRSVAKPDSYGKFYSPKEVAQKLVSIARSRISDNHATSSRSSQNGN